MLRFAWKSQAPLAALLIVVGSGTVTAGVFDLWKSPAKKPRSQDARRIVARGQEPNPAPPAPLNVGPDPAYNPPAAPPQTETPAPGPSSVWMPPVTAGDCAPQYSGFSGGYAPSACMGHACTGCRESNSLCGMNMAKSSARMHGDSYYCDCFPLFGPRYGYYETCWRRLPEDCRCPIFIPPRKSQSATEPVPTEVTPGSEVTPPPPQALNFR